MKKSLLAILLSIVFIISVSAQSNWEWINAYPAGNYPAYSCQSQGRVFYLGWPKTFFCTSDGGNSFNVNTPYSKLTDSEWSAFDMISFADSLHGILLDEEGPFRTTDGGISWRRVFPSVYDLFSCVVFGSENVGWMYGSPGLNKTTDSGNSWFYVSAQSLFDIKGTAACTFALNKDSLWICKNYHYNNGGAICFSSDGGYNWTEQNSIASDTNNQVYYNDIKFSKSGTGLAIGQILINALHPHYIPFLLRTLDFGNTWQQVPIDTTIGLKVIVSLNNDEWLIFGNDNNSLNNEVHPLRLKSLDGGLSWDYKYNIFNSNSNYNSANTAEYISEDNTILVSGYFGIYRSLDRGETFKRLSGKNDIQVEGIALDKHTASENQLAVAVSQGDSAIVSSDGGRNWNKKYLSGAGNFSGEVAVADDVIFAVINGELHKSVDSGNSWQKIIKDFYNIRNLTAFDKNNVAFLTYSGYETFVEYTTDGGNYWARTPFFQFSSDITLMAEGKILACGSYYDTASSNRGYIYTSDDYGHNWRAITTRYDMTKIKAVNKTTALAISNYEVYRSEDAGKSWYVSKSSDDYYNYFANFAFKDSLHGILQISYQLYNSGDAGRNWSRSGLSLPVWGGADFMEYNNKGDLLINDNGYLCIYKNQDYSGKNNNPDNALIQGFNLSQNYPNPFNPGTTINYQLPQNGFVTLKIFDILGKEVATLVNEYKTPGRYTINFEASRLSSGVYIYQLRVNDYISSKKMLLLK